MKYIYINTYAHVWNAPVCWKSWAHLTKAHSQVKKYFNFLFVTHNSSREEEKKNDSSNNWHFRWKTCWACRLDYAMLFLWISYFAWYMPAYRHERERKCIMARHNEIARKKSNSPQKPNIKYCNVRSRKSECLLLHICVCACTMCKMQNYNRIEEKFLHFQCYYILFSSFFFLYILKYHVLSIPTGV